MHPRAQQFAAEAAEQFGVEVDVHEFDEGTKTAADAAEVVGCDVAQIASSLVFVADGEPVVVITSGANRVDEDRLAGELGAEAVAMAEADTVKEATGYSIGGVAPFCHATDLQVLIDETLLEYGEVWAAAGTPQTVFPIDPDRLVALSGATPADVADPA
jgi:prolyl-tRNA editing enzyme YbaK/EbsC (Cys-tRNA(Pro) deacylase)